MPWHICLSLTAPSPQPDSCIRSQYRCDPQLLALEVKARGLSALSGEQGRLHRKGKNSARSRVVFVRFVLGDVNTHWVLPSTDEARASLPV